MSETSLVYIHIGKQLPTDNNREISYLYESIYQSLLVSPNNKIFVIIDDTLLEDFNNKIKEFNLSNTLNVNTIPISTLGDLNNDERFSKYVEYVNSLSNDTTSFRNGFWVSTTSRFFYIEKFMELFKVDKVFHIESDVMIYENLENIYDICKNKNDSIYMVQDSKDRVIPSILYIHKLEQLTKLNNYIINVLVKGQMINDMILLGTYSDKNYFPYKFEDNHNDIFHKYIFDGAAIGQYLGGIDPNNIPNVKKIDYICNPTSNMYGKGFVNETCDFKPNRNDIHFFLKDVYLNNKTNVLVPFCKKENYNNDIFLKQIVNLHIHSKQLYHFSSIFNLKYTDIITGDRVLSLCDFVIMTPDIYNYHKNIEVFVKDISKIIIIKDFSKVNVNTLNGYFSENNTKTVKLFIYTHILDQFIEHVLDKLDKNLNYIIYLHNSDHSFGDTDTNSALTKHHSRLVSANHIIKIYSQNINYPINTEYDSKLSVLPIGLANSMFPHGDTVSLYETMINTYFIKKKKNMYVNINPNTFNYRKTVLDSINEAKDKYDIITKPKPFKDYLKELSEYRFCLCVRGNGLDTHRFFESLYLGVIPVILNNKYTNMNNFVYYLKKAGIPFYEITQENFTEKYIDSFFDEKLYNKILENYNIHNLESIKLYNYR